MGGQAVLVAEFKEALITKFAVKTGKMGESIGVITIEVEAMDPGKEFKPVIDLHMLKSHVLIQAKGE